MCLGCIITHDTSSKTGSSEPIAPFACALCPPSRQTPIQAPMVVPESKRRKQGGKKIHKPSRMTIYEPLGSEGWDTRVGVPWPSRGDSALQPLLPPPDFHLAEGISPPLWIKFSPAHKLGKSSGFCVCCSVEVLGEKRTCQQWHLNLPAKPLPASRRVCRESAQSDVGGKLFPSKC